MIIDLNYRVDILKGIVSQNAEHPLYYDDQNAHRVNVSLYRGQEEINLSGLSCNGYVVFVKEGASIGPLTGEVSNNTCSVVLPHEAYQHPGAIRVEIKLIEGDSVTTVLMLTGHVSSGRGDRVIDITGSIVPSLDSLKATIEELERRVAAIEVSEVVELGERVNALHTLVNYGYDISASNDHNLKSRVGTRVVLDGTTTGNTSTKIILTGEPMWVRSGAFPSTVTSGVRLTNGHRYRLYTVYISGSTLLFVNPYWTAPGSWTAPTGTVTYGDGYCILDYNTTDYPNGAIAYLLIPKDNTLSDYTVQVFAEDITEGTGVVRYNIAQDMTDSQKAQARENIAASNADVTDLLAEPIEYWDADRTVTLSGRSLTRTGGYTYTMNGTASGNLYYRLSNVLSVISTTSGMNNWTSSIQFEENVPYTLTVVPVSGRLVRGDSFYFRVTAEDNTLVRSLSVTDAAESVTFYWPDSTKKGKLVLRVSTDTVTENFVFRVYLTRCIYPDRNIAETEASVSRIGYGVGSLLTMGGTLYKTTQTIAAGETITPGTNVTDTTVAEQLAERDTAIAAVSSAARAGVLATLDAGCYVDWGWVPGEQTATVAGVTVTRNGNRVKLNGVSTGNFFVRMVGDLLVRTSSPTAAQVIAGCPTIAGHEYQYQMRLVSGSAALNTAHSNAFLLSAAAYKAGSTTAFDNHHAQRIEEEGWALRDFTSDDGADLSVWLWCATRATFSNAEYELTLLDVTATEQTDYATTMAKAALTAKLGTLPVEAYGKPGSVQTGNKVRVSKSWGNRVRVDAVGIDGTAMVSIQNGVSYVGNWTPNDSMVEYELDAGHTYRLTARYISGTVTQGGTTDSELLLLLKGSSQSSPIGTQFTTTMISNINNGITEWENVRTFAEPTKIGFGFYLRQLTANALIIEFLCEDVTDSNDIAPADKTTAVNTHTAGSLLTVNGTLYKATQAIATGETITPGTNVDATTVAAELASRDLQIADRVQLTEQTLEFTEKRQARQNIEALPRQALANAGVIEGKHPKLALESRSGTSNTVLIEGNAELLTLNGTSSSGFVISLLGDYPLATGSSTVPGATSLAQGPFDVVPGHTYRMRIRLVSGSYTGGDPYLELFDTTGTVISGMACNLSQGERTFVMDDRTQIGQYGVFFYKSTTYNNATFAMEWVDITACPDIAALAMTPSAYFANLLGGHGRAGDNAKEILVSGNHVRMRGTYKDTSSYTTYSMFNVLGNLGAVTGTYSIENVKKLFTNGYCYTVTGRPLFAQDTGAILRVAYTKKSERETPLEWGWGYGLYTYNASTDTLTNLVHKYSMSEGNGILIYDMFISASLINTARDNGNLALVIYGKGSAQAIGNSIDLYWEIIPAISTT